MGVDGVGRGLAERQRGGRCGSVDCHKRLGCGIGECQIAVVEFLEIEGVLGIRGIDVVLLVLHDVARGAVEEGEVEVGGCRGKHTTERCEQLCRELLLGRGGEVALQNGRHIGELAHGVVDGVVLATLCEVLVYARSEACRGNGCCHDKPHAVS